LKSELIELDVKIEELQKTKDVYSFQSDNSRNIFSPLPVPSEHRSKGQILQTQIDELQEVRTSLMDKIHAADVALASIRTLMNSLERANDSLVSLSQNLPQPEPEPTAPEIAEEAAQPEEPVATEAYHACQILMLHQYDKSQTAAQIRSTITEGLENNQNKLEVLKWLIQSDPTRARLTLQELQDANDRLLQSSQKLSRKLSRNLTHQLPIWKAIDEMVQSYQSRHPEVILHASVDCPDYDIQVMPIITITVLQLLQEVLDNAFYYSNANKIIIQTYINSRMIDIYVNDNGAGIPSDYMTSSSWHSGLHRLHEIVHLFGGKVQIDGDIISGTNVRFSFPICLEEANEKKS
jgi:two-component system sensor histidine kinase DegS